MKINVEPIRGMRDILPPESTAIKALIRCFEDIARSYGYSEVIPPTVESFSLFAVKSGPEISRSMYVFQDKAGRKVCLRPELTASIARIYLKSLKAEPKPIKIFYVGSAFRYEEPQHGRYREFIQAGVEYIGDESIYSDIELLLLLRDYYSAIGLQSYSIKINDVGILRMLFSRWGISDEVQDLLLHYMDKKLFDKVTDIIKDYPKADLELFRGVTNVKTDKADELLEVHNLLRNFPEVTERVKRLVDILSIAKELNIKSIYADLSFARGLAYYTGLIFEVTVPNLNVSIGGGGRYDTLIELYGGPATPATGFALGIERTYLALRDLGSVGDFDKSRKYMLISLVNDYKFVDNIASKLRSGGCVVDVRFTTKGKLGDLISLASRRGFNYVVIVGEKEVRSGKVVVRNLVSRTQKEVDVDKVMSGGVIE